MDLSKTLQINVSEIVQIGVSIAKKVFKLVHEVAKVVFQFVQTAWAPTLARSPSVFFNRFNITATF